MAVLVNLHRLLIRYTLKLTKYISAFLFLVWATCAPGIAALEVETSPGLLHEKVGNAANVQKLTVTGSVDVRDFEFIASEMPSLETLDLSDAAIAAYEGAPTFTGRTSHHADVLPECALMCHALENIVLPRNLKAIADGALGGSGIKSLTIPEGVTHIGISAFGNCRQLESATIPAGVIEIGENVFKGCRLLRNVIIDSQLDDIPDGAFSECEKLATISHKGGFNRIGESAFAGCRELRQFVFPTELTEIGARAFYATGLERADMSHCGILTRIGGWAFANTPALAEVMLGSAVTEICAGAFFNDVTLDPGCLPASVEKIGNFAFKGIDASDKDVIAATRIDSIGAYALAQWQNATAIVLPPTLEYIGDGAMADWGNLQHISAEALETIPALGADVWRGVHQSDVILVVPRPLADEYRDTPQWMEFDIRSGGSVDVDAPLTSLNEPADAIKIRFGHDNLIIESTAAIEAVSFYDMQGRTFQLPCMVNGTNAIVNMAAWNAPVIMACIRLADGTSHTVKLTR